MKQAIREAKVIAVKKSAVRNRTYFLTVDDGLGEIRLVADRAYSVGDTVRIVRRNPVDWDWKIVK